MDIMTWVFWFIAMGNALFAQGYHYDLLTGRFVAPTEQRGTGDSDRAQSALTRGAAGHRRTDQQTEN